MFVLVQAKSCVVFFVRNRGKTGVKQKWQMSALVQAKNSWKCAEFAGLRYLSVWHLTTILILSKVLILGKTVSSGCMSFSVSPLPISFNILSTSMQFLINQNNSTVKIEYWINCTRKPNFLDFPSTPVFLVGESSQIAGNSRSSKINARWITFMNLNKDLQR